MPPGRAPVMPTDFNTFAALGLQPATATQTDLRPAFFHAIRHRHENVTARHTASANLFLSQVQVQTAYDYLTAGTQFFSVAVNQWTRGHQDIFHPWLPIGNVDVFSTDVEAANAPEFFARALASAASSASASGSHPCPAASAPASSPGGGSASAHAESSTDGSSRRSTPYGSGTRTQPWTVDSSSDDDDSTQDDSSIDGSSPDDDLSSDDDLSEDDDLSNDDDAGKEGSPTPTPAPSTLPRRRSCPYFFSFVTSNASSFVGPSAGATRPTPSPSAGAAKAASASRVGGRANRNIGRSRRNAYTPKPVLGVRIVVGKWLWSPNAVVASFDARGRIFYRITKRDIKGMHVGAPSITAISFHEIIPRLPYQNLNAAQLRHTIDAHLRLRPKNRP
jgi:hypothetical protein